MTVSNFRTSTRRTLRLFITITAFVTSACASVTAPQAAACAFSDRDQAWVERALEAWRFTSREITGIAPMKDFQGIFFSADCVMRSNNALSSLTGEGVTWSAAPHDGTIALPDGSDMPAGVTSFVSGNNGVMYFVMSTPTVWEAAGVGKGTDLETTMVAVLLHEGSHVAQIGPYGPRLGALIERHDLPDSFNDNAVQDRFEENAAFAESVKEETRLFLAAALAEEDAEAKQLAREARGLMRARQARWMTGDDAYLIEAEDIWLTFEGAGQWTGYQWRIHPRGGAKDDDQAIERFTERFTKGRQWSQTEGFALVMALYRIMGPGWKRHAFGDGEKTVLQMLDEALAAD